MIIRKIILLLTVFAALYVTASRAYAKNGSVVSDIEDFLGRLEGHGGAKAAEDWMEEEESRYGIGADGYLQHIGAPPGKHWTVSTAVPGMPEETARLFLSGNAGVFGIKSPDVDFTVKKNRNRNLRDYVRFQQTYRGIPIFGAEVIVQLNEQLGVEYVLSDIATDLSVFDDGNVPTEPALLNEGAVSTARDLVADKESSVKLTSKEPELKIFAPSVLGVVGTMHLVWDVTVYSEEDPLLGERMLLDAHSGKAIRRYPLAIPDLYRKIYDCDDSIFVPPVPTRAEGDDPTGIEDVDDAYDWSGDAYDFYSDHHGRDGINDPVWPIPTLNVQALVRYCLPGGSCPWQNAHWNMVLLRMAFGSPHLADDTVGHEYTHGVTQFESSLIYEYQSGAINESFSDTWGQFIDLTNGDGNDTPEVRWLCGEDMDDGASRNMADPCDPPPDCSAGENIRQPDRMSSDEWYSGDWDNGGVHVNSGVGNKLVYLLVDGDTFNGRTVSGMGISRIADLYYEVQTNLLPSAADYYDLGDALEQAASNLGWNSGDRENLHEALRAVEIARRQDVYVDRAMAGQCLGPNGTRSCIFIDDNLWYGPWHSIEQGLDFAQPGDIMNIATGSYDETPTFDTYMKIRSWNGPVTIGR